MSNTIEEITSVLNAERVGGSPARIDWILTDSRSLCFPEETLFLPSKQNVMMAINIYLNFMTAV